MIGLGGKVCRQRREKRPGFSFGYISTLRGISKRPRRIAGGRGRTWEGEVL